MGGGSAGLTSTDELEAGACLLALDVGTVDSTLGAKTRECVDDTDSGLGVSRACASFSFLGMSRA